MRRTTLVLWGLLAGCAAPDAFQERRLATIPEGFEVSVPPAFTPDGRQVAYVGSNHDGFWVFRGDWKSRRLDAI